MIPPGAACLCKASVAAIIALAATTSMAAEQRAGIFRLDLPGSFTPVAGAKLEELRRQMQGGAQRLAESSGLGDPRDVSGKGLSFFAAFSGANGRLTVAFAGNQLAEPTDIDEMDQANRERIRWGIDTGRLRRSSRGVSRVAIDGVPCLLQDIEHASGARLRTWLCFVPEAPKAHFSATIVCDDAPTCARHEADIDGAIRSMKIVRRAR